MTRPEAMRLCREMYGSWTGAQVQTYLAEHGVRVSRATVVKWADPDLMQRYLDYNRAYKRERAMYDRIVTLRDHGLSVRGIAIVMTVDFGFDVSPYLVRQALDLGQVGLKMRKAMASS